MSHASVLVAISKQQLDEFEDLDDAIAHQMAPFEEGGTWFKEGSRWDWYVIGGRYSGRFCGEDVILRKDFDMAKWTASNIKEAEKDWPEVEKEIRKMPPEVADMFYGFSPNITKEEYLKLVGERPFGCYAFLKNRQWHEHERMGWFGMKTATECEVEAQENGEKFEGRCVNRDEETGAMIVNWTGPKDSEEQWKQMYYRRFIQDLPDDTTLVVVDYHV